MLTIFYNFLLFAITNFYSLSYVNIAGTTVNMNSYAGKKILLVNVATESIHVAQLASLQQLQQQFADSLVVIGFASNSFGHESKTNAAILQFCQQQYNISFPLAAKNNVTGSAIQPVYNWLANQTENGVMQGLVKTDFQKFLINKQGNLIGVFAGAISPLDVSVVNAIQSN
jgi:glutathione peroxidase